MKQARTWEGYITVTLTPWEIMTGAIAGVMRQTENIKDKRQNAGGYDGTKDWQIHIEGAIGEYAVAKEFGYFWPGKGKFRDPDFGDMDSRCAGDHDSPLRIEKKDPDHRIVWHITGRNGSYRIHGWTYARNGKKPENWYDLKGLNRPAYWFPTESVNRYVPTEDE
jgi:hypothetical protein